jgi:muconolactone delta-isomerase
MSQTFMVERSLPGIPMDQLAAAQQRAISTAGEMRAQGTPVSYIRSTFVPGTGQCMCLFSADDAQQVEQLNRQANIPFDRVVPAMDLTPP